MKIRLVCIVIVCVQVTFLGLDVKAQDSEAAISVEYCDLMGRPADFDGKRVTIRATFRYGFEWQELYCLGCRDFGKTWLETSEISKNAKGILRKFPKNDGTINATFTGIFQSSNGPFGDGGYRYRLLLREISQPELLSRSGADPNSLAEKVREHACAISKKGKNGEK